MSKAVVSVIYTLDGLLYLWLQDYLSVGFHILALFFIFQGYSASRKLQDLQSRIETVEVGQDLSDGINNDLGQNPY